MQKRLIHTCLLLLMAVGSMQAQEDYRCSLVPMIGMTTSTLTGEDHEHKDYQTGLGGAIGAELEFLASKRRGLSVGLLFKNEHIGMEGDAYHVIAVGLGDLLERNDFQLSISTLDCFLMYNRRVGYGFTLKAGIQGSYALSSKVWSNNALYLDNPTTQEKELYQVTRDSQDCGWNKPEWSIPIGISYEYRNLILDARYHFSLQKQPDTFVGWWNECQVGHRHLMLTLGYRIGLKAQ